MKEPKKIVAYLMPDYDVPGEHPFLVMRRTEKNRKGRYVTGEEFFKLGLGPSSIAKTQDDLAMLIGKAILAEAV